MAEASIYLSMAAVQDAEPPPGDDVAWHHQRLCDIDL